MRWLRRFAPVCCLLMCLSNNVTAQDEPAPAPAPPESGGDTPRSVELPGTTVVGESPGAMTAPTADEAAAQLRAVPGSTTLIEAEQFRARRVGSIADVLQLAPSVYSESRFGGSENRISIRGSGISQTFEGRGVRVLRNGLPLTDADGFVRTQFMEPLLIQHAEVYPGANGMTWGASTLGGVVNLITPTGYSADLLRIHTEFGSQDWVRGQLSSGAVLGDTGFDYFLSMSGLTTDGFRDNGAEQFLRFYGNVGYRPDDHIEHRLHFGWQRIRLDLPGSLTWDQVEDDPSQANRLWESADGLRDFDDVFRVDWQTAVELDLDSRLDFGASWQYYDMFHALPSFRDFVPPFDDQIITTYQDDVTFNVRYTHDGELFGYDNEVIAGTYFGYGSGETRFYTSSANSTEKNTLARVEDSTALTWELFAEDRLHVTDTLTLIAGLQFALARRDVETEQVDMTMPLGGGFTGDDTYHQLNPRVGFTWQAVEWAQLFGNVSRSFEPPTLTELGDSTGDTLDAQDAWTFELGARGGDDRLDWQVAGYYTLLNDEILTVGPAGDTETGNAEDTVHAGIELSLGYRHPLALLAGALDNEPDALSFRVTYALNEFHFRDDPTWGDNRIPGIPQHVIRAELLYEHPSGFYVGPNVQVAAGDAYVDFANTLENETFAILGLRAGYEHPSKRWSIFIVGENLTDKHYASNFSIIADASAGFGTPAVFNPGRPASVFAGFEFRY